MTKQPYLGRALLALEGGAPIKGEVKKAHPPPNLTVTPRAVDLHNSGTNNRRKIMKKLIIATWNVRTMLDDDTSNRPRRRTALIDLELESINAEITALQEVRLSGEGQLREAGRTFFWKGLPDGQPRRAGVGFALKNELADKLTEHPKGISERIITLRLSLAPNKYLTIINVYAPTMVHQEEEKEAFYAQLRTLVSSVPEADKLILLGDFNARVGCDHDTWGPVLGKFGKGQQNSNGELLTCLCAELKLSITNTFFKQPDEHFYSWVHPRSKRPHLLDYIAVKSRDIKDVYLTRAMRGPDCHTDHYVIKSVLNLQICCSRNKTGPQKKKKIMTANLDDPSTRLRLEQEMSSALNYNSADSDSPDDLWNKMSKDIYEAASNVLGYSRKQNRDWFNENDQGIKAALDMRNRALKAKLSNPNSVNIRKLKDARAKLQRDLRKMEDEWWLHKAEELQKYADENNSAGFFKSLKLVHGPQAKMSNTLLSKDGATTISEPNKLMERWCEYFKDLLNVEAETDDSILNKLPVYRQRADLDIVPTREEVVESINKMKNGKAPGNDGIPSEIFKCGGEVLTDKLHLLIVKSWQQGIIPQGFKDVSIIPIFKKGDHRDCGNYRGISLLAIAGKIMAKIAQTRLSSLAEDILTESQCGFRRQRSTIDMIFSLRQIQEKAVEQYRDLYIIFIDFRKAFDTVDRLLLWKVLEAFGCPPLLVKIIREFHDGTKGRVSVGNDLSEEIAVSHGTKQGCVLAPTLFSLFLTVVLLIMQEETNDGIYIRHRTDGGLFNLSRLKAVTKTKTELIRELLFADDTALVAHTKEQAQILLNVFAATSKKMGLHINSSKTEVLFQPSPNNTSPEDPVISVDGESLKVVSSFKYLGSTITTDGRADKEITCRIQNACASFGKLENRLWKRPGIKLSTKCKVYRTVVLPALLYSAETYSLYRQHIQRLEAVQQRHLRRIMGIRWQDRISNVEVLRRAGLESVTATLAATQLRWLGHVARMEDSRIPKLVLYGEMAEGRRRQGGQKLRYKDVAKRHMKAMDLDPKNWEELAADRAKWRCSLYNGKATINNKIVTASDLQHYRRHNPGDRTCSVCTKTFHSDRGLLQHHRMMHHLPT